MKNTLVADDSATWRYVIRATIETLGGMVVAEAADGIEALELYRRHKPDFMLLDINMPQMSGVEVLRAIRKEYPKAVVGMLTTESTLIVVKECIGLGAATFLIKTNANNLNAQLQAFWGRFPAEGAPPAT